jgi:hypothetical protein
MMDNFPHPPWNVESGEATVSDSAAFNQCEEAMTAFASRVDGKITDRRHSISQKWGRVLRAKVVFSRASVAGTTLVTCWSGAGPGIQMAVEVEGCGPQQAGC